MADKSMRCQVVVAGLLIVALAVGGCRRETTPDTRQARLVAAESMQLKEKLADLRHQIDRLKAEHARQIGQRDKQLAASRQRIEALEKDLRKGIAARVDNVTATVVDENARLRRDIQQLRAEIEELKARGAQTP